jgi:WD40 repeat protein
MEHVLKGRGIDTPEQSVQHTADEEGDKITITDLEHLDPLGESKDSWLTSPLLRWQRAPHRRRWRLTGTVSFLLLLLVLLCVSSLSPASIMESFRRVYAPPAHPSPSGSALPVLPQRDGITCLRDAMWSPESRLIAVVGYAQTCSSVAYVPGLVNLYEAGSSQLLRQLHPDAAIVQALKGASGSAGEPSARVSQQKQGGGSGLVISYLHVVWSPDTQRLALTFHLAAPSPSLDGIVLMNRDGTHAQVLLDQQNPLAPSYAEWDLERRRLITSNVFPFPPASAYQWGPKGTVLPGRLLPTQFLPAAPPLGPIGNPDGDASFTLWQPAVAQVTSFTDPSGTYRIHSWSTSFAAWSPDGRYLINDMSFWGLLTSPKVISAGTPFFQGSDPARDGSETGAQGVTNQCAAQLQAVKTTLAFAWSPNGRVLADYGAGKRVDLYDCTTGHKLAPFTLQSQYAAPSADAVTLRWSPDGSQLLLSSVASGPVSFWKFDR